jgi:hypothetical protein
MNSKLSILTLVLILGTAMVSGCNSTIIQSSAAEPTVGSVHPAEAPVETVTVVKTEVPTPEPTPTAEPDPSGDDDPVAYDYEGWEAFRSDRFGYTFLVPAGVEVLEGTDGTVNTAGPLVDNERWPCITVSSYESDFYRPPAGTDVVEWVSNSGMINGEIDSGVEIDGRPSAHVAAPASPQAYAVDEYYVIQGDRLFRIAITHCGRQDWGVYDPFLASFTFDDTP